MIRQRRLYETAPYLMACRAHVIAVGRRHLVLETTTLTPARAGIEGDLGMIDAAEVEASMILPDGETVAHEVEGASDFRVAQEVYVEADAFRRFGLMKNATACDLVALSLLDLGVRIDGVEVSATGSSIHLVRRTAIDLAELTTDVNAAISARLPIRIGPPRVGGTRLCHVEGCGLLLGWGPRVAKTLEVGGVRLSAHPAARAARRIECSLTRGIGSSVPHLFRSTRHVEAWTGPSPPKGARR